MFLCDQDGVRTFLPSSVVFPASFEAEENDRDQRSPGPPAISIIASNPPRISLTLQDKGDRKAVVESLNPRAFDSQPHDILACVALTYCDHNFIVTAHQEPDVYKDHLTQLAATGAVTFVLSPMHWVEAAEDDDAARGTSKADFMDSLRARWLYDRRTIQRKEVTNAFFRFARIPGDAPQMMGDVADVIADLAGQRAHRDSRAFVTHLRGIGANHPLEQNLRQAFETNRQNGDRFRAGTLTPAITERVRHLYIKQLVPTETPAGVLVDSGSKDQFADASQLTDFPSIALEMRATHDNWRQARQLNRNNFMDQQHLMALPYADFFITDDAKLRALTARISVGLPFPIATLLTKAEFDLRHP